MEDGGWKIKDGGIRLKVTGHRLNVENRIKEGIKERTRV
jgi:hypothetical protein